MFPPTCPSYPAHMSNPLEGFFFLPAAAGCGVPPPLPNADPLWDGDSTVGSLVVYQCRRGFRSVANVSVCTARGKWDVTSVLCEGVVAQSARRHFDLPAVGHMSSCSEPLAITNADMLMGGTALAGSQVFYLCRLERSRGNPSISRDYGMLLIC